jgi:hypothetical protein
MFKIMTKKQPPRRAFVSKRPFVDALETKIPMALMDRITSLLFPYKNPAD